MSPTVAYVHMLNNSMYGKTGPIPFTLTEAGNTVALIDAGTLSRTHYTNALINLYLESARAEAVARQLDIMIQTAAIGMVQFETDVRVALHIETPFRPHENFLDQ